MHSTGCRVHKLSSCGDEFSYSSACGVIPNQGSSLCLRHWQLSAFFITESPGKPCTTFFFFKMALFILLLKLFLEKDQHNLNTGGLEVKISAFVSTVNFWFEPEEGQTDEGWFISKLFALPEPFQL